MIEQVIFDVDLTLLNSFESVLVGYQEIARREGLEVPTKSVLKGLWGQTLQEIYSGLWPGADLNKLMTVGQTVFEGCSIQLATGVLEVLTQIRRSGIALGILSTTPRTLFETRLESVGVQLDWFELIVGGDDIPVRKPDPKVFEGFIRHRSPHTIVYVGDDIVDWQAARDAKIGFFAVTTLGFTPVEKFKSENLDSERILKSITDLPISLGLVNSSETYLVVE